MTVFQKCTNPTHGGFKNLKLLQSINTFNNCSKITGHLPQSLSYQSMNCRDTYKSTDTVDDPSHILHSAHGSEKLPIAGWEARLFVGEKPLSLRLNLGLPTDDFHWNSFTTRAPALTSATLCCLVICSFSLWVVLQVEMLNVSLTGCVDASGLELSSTAGVALQQADDGGVTLRSFDELLQRQLTYNTDNTSTELCSLPFLFRHTAENKKAV